MNIGKIALIAILGTLVSGCAVLDRIDGQLTQAQLDALAQLVAPIVLEQVEE